MPSGLTFSAPDLPYARGSVLLDLFGDNMRRWGSRSTSPSPTAVSSDIGNVSQVVPTIHPWVANAPTHGDPQREFRDSAVSPLARAGLLTGAKAMAMIALDLLANSALIARAKTTVGKRPS